MEERNYLFCVNWESVGWYWESGGGGGTVNGGRGGKIFLIGNKSNGVKFIVSFFFIKSIFSLCIFTLNVI